MRGLYAIVDPEHCRGRDPLHVAERILEGGCAALQLRAKQLGWDALLGLSRALRERCHAAHVPFWLNDYLEVALAVEADGLHLGQDDLPVAEARRRWGSRLVGLSTHNPGQVRSARVDGADLIGFGPLFDTSSKLRPDPTVGFEGLAKAVALAGEAPVVAIGGLRPEHAERLRASGASYAAAIGAVCGADDPRAAAEAFHGALRGA